MSLAQTGGSSGCVMPGRCSEVLNTALCCSSDRKDAEELSSGTIFLFLSHWFVALSFTWHHLTAGWRFDYSVLWSKHPCLPSMVCLDFLMLKNTQLLNLDCINFYSLHWVPVCCQSFYKWSTVQKPSTIPSVIAVLMCRCYHANMQT